jgi:hypothetical protein
MELVETVTQRTELCLVLVSETVLRLSPLPTSHFEVGRMICGSKADERQKKHVETSSTCRARGGWSCKVAENSPNPGRATPHGMGNSLVLVPKRPPCLTDVLVETRRVSKRRGWGV